MDDLVRFFDPYAEIHRTQNRLPHWEQPGACYFLTWRLADALPAGLVAEWKSQRALWLKHHPPPWTPKLEREYHQRFAGATERWLDAGYGSCLLRTPAYAEIVSQALHHFDRERYLLYSTVVMPNHVHALISLHPKDALKKVVQSWKGYTSRAINERQSSGGPIWERDYYDRFIRDGKHFANCVRYIRRNPEKARLRAGGFILYESDLALTIE